MHYFHIKRACLAFAISRIGFSFQICCRWLPGLDVVGRRVALGSQHRWRILEGSITSILVSLTCNVSLNWLFFHISWSLPSKIAQHTWIAVTVNLLKKNKNLGTRLYRLVFIHIKVAGSLYLSSGCWEHQVETSLSRVVRIKGIQSPILMFSFAWLKVNRFLLTLLTSFRKVWLNNYRRIFIFVLRDNIAHFHPLDSNTLPTL